MVKVMTDARTSRDAAGGARHKLLDAALALIRTKGYAATTVDDICTAAAVTKGAFFHHFKSKEALGIAALHLDRDVDLFPLRQRLVEKKAGTAMARIGLQVPRVEAARLAANAHGPDV